VIFLYFFVVVGTQESNAAAFKTIYELNSVNRIASRLETVVEKLYTKQYAIVVIGDRVPFPRQKYVRSPNEIKIPQLAVNSFPIYRQPEFLNYLFGRDVFTSPTAEQVEKAISSSLERQPWPAKESVFVLDGDIVVVLLEKYRLGLPITTIQD
jgi:hypothetical protein